MLKILNRHLPNNNSNNKVPPKKSDNLDLLALIDKCTQILREDRILLRSALKDQQSTRLLETLNRFKKRGGEDLGELQIELRRMVNELKGKRSMVSPEPKDFKKKSSKENQCLLSPVGPQRKTKENSNRSVDKKAQHSISESKMSNAKQLSNTNQSTKQRCDTIELSQQVVLVSEKCSPLRSEEDQLQFMTIVSQTPFLSNLKDRLNTGGQFDGSLDEIILKYNVEEINAFGEVDKAQLCSNCQGIRDNVIDVTYFPYILPEIESLHYRENTQLSNRELFTDWQSILKPSHKPQYIITEKTLLPEQEVLEFRINGISADSLFLVIFPNNCVRRLNLYQMRVNVDKGIENGDLDIDMLFRMCDTDGDGWVSPEDVGDILQLVCQSMECTEEFLVVEQLMMGQQCLTMDRLSQYLEVQVEEGILQDLEVELLGRRLFEEIDIESRGYLSKWDLFQNKNIDQVQRLIQLL